MLTLLYPRLYPGAHPNLPQSLSRYIPLHAASLPVPILICPSLSPGISRSIPASLTVPIPVYPAAPPPAHVLCRRAPAHARSRRPGAAILSAGGGREGHP